MLLLSAAEQSPSVSRVSLIVTGNTRGAIEPCGCSRDRNRGGLARRVAVVKRLKAENPEALLVDAGSQTPDAESVEIVCGILAMTPYDAIGVGAADVGLGDAFFKAAGAHALPLVSAAPEAPGDGSACPSMRFVSKGDVRWAVTSVAGPSSAKQNAPVVDHSALRARLVPLMRATRGKAEVVVVLSDLGCELDRVVFQGGEGASAPDLVVSRGLPDTEAHSGVWLVPGPADADAVVAVSGTRAEGWSDLTVTKFRVGSTDPQDPDARRAVSGYFAAQEQALLLRAAERPADWDTKPYAAAEECRECHPKQHRAWQTTAHAQAVRTLKDDGRLVPECLACHSELYRRSKLFPRDDPAAWNGVECATCHGEGILHAQIGTKGAISRRVAEKTCRGCHEAEHDPGFEYEENVKLVEHG